MVVRGSFEDQKPVGVEVPRRPSGVVVMPAPRIDYAVLPAGEGPGQDRCFTADGLVVVLDGASAIDPVANPDAIEYVDTLGSLLIEQIAGTPGIDLRDALAEVIRRAVAKLSLVAGTAPSSTVSIVRWGGEAVDVLVLGDSPIVGRFKDRSHRVIVQHSQEHIAPDLRRLYRERLARPWLRRRTIVQSSLQFSVKRQRSGIGPVAILSPKRTLAPGHMPLVSAGRRQSSRMWWWLPTEPGPAAVEAWTAPTPHLLLERLRQIHDWEQYEDPNGILRPRSKRHDDKTLAVIGEW